MFVYIIIVPNFVAVVSVPSVIAHHVVGGGYACGISILLQSILLLLLFCCCHYQLLLLLLLLFLVLLITLVVASHAYFVVILDGTSMLFVRHLTCMLFLLLFISLCHWCYCHLCNSHCRYTTTDISVYLCCTCCCCCSCCLQWNHVSCRICCC